ncbi:hypothetical protein DIPPA_62096 [Diplonema papillatum]|nr:hypothetical protein DIPPA_62096 [Diplonema papillatum]
MKRVDIDTYKTLKCLGEKVSNDGKSFALSVYDRCIDPDGVHARCSRRPQEESRWLVAAVMQMKSDGRKEAAERLLLMVKRLATMAAEGRAKSMLSTAQCSKTDLLHVTPGTISSVLAILAQLSRKGGLTHPQSEFTMRMLNLPSTMLPPLDASSWRPLALITRGNNDETVKHPLLPKSDTEQTIQKSHNAFERISSVKLNLFTRLSNQTDDPMCAQGTTFARSAGMLYQKDCETLQNRDSSSLSQSIIGTERSIDDSCEPEASSSWARWLSSSDAIGSNSASGFRSSDSFMAGLCLAYISNPPLAIAREEDIVKACLDCLCRKTSPLIERIENAPGSGCFTWCLRKVGDQLPVVAAGWSPAAMERVVEPVLSAANLQETLTRAAMTGSRRTRSSVESRVPLGPTLPLFCETLQQLLVTWGESAAAVTPLPKLVSIPSTVERLLTRKLRTVSKLLLQHTSLFPVGSIVLDSLYRETEAAISRGDKEAEGILLFLFNASVKPLLSSISQHMHGQLNSAGWLSTARQVEWESLPLPSFLKSVAEAICAADAVRDVRVTDPEHSIFREHTAQDLPGTSVASLGMARTSGSRSNGAAGLLSLLVPPPQSFGASPVVAVTQTGPISRNVDRSVSSAAQMAKAIAELSAARRADTEREAACQKQQADRLTTAKAAVKKLRAPQVPSEAVTQLPKRIRDRGSQAVKEGLDAQLKEKAELAAAAKAAEKLQDTALASPKFTQSQIDVVKEVVTREYESKIRNADERLESTQQHLEELKTPTAHKPTTNNNNCVVDPAASLMEQSQRKSSGTELVPPFNAGTPAAAASLADRSSLMAEVLERDSHMTNEAGEDADADTELLAEGTVLRSSSSNALTKSIRREDTLNLFAANQEEIDPTGLARRRRVARRYRLRKNGEGLDKQLPAMNPPGKRRRHHLASQQGRESKQRCISTVSTEFGSDLISLLPLQARLAIDEANQHQRQREEDAQAKAAETTKRKPSKKASRKRGAGKSKTKTAPDVAGTSTGEMADKAFIVPAREPLTKPVEECLPNEGPSHVSDDPSVTHSQPAAKYYDYAEPLFAVRVPTAGFPSSKALVGARTKKAVEERVKRVLMTPHSIEGSAWDYLLQAGPKNGGKQRTAVLGRGKEFSDAFATFRRKKYSDPAEKQPKSKSQVVSSAMDDIQSLHQKVQQRWQRPTQRVFGITHVRTWSSATLSPERWRQDAKTQAKSSLRQRSLRGRLASHLIERECSSVSRSPARVERVDGGVKTPAGTMVGALNTNGSHSEEHIRMVVENVKRAWTSGTPLPAEELPVAVHCEKVPLRIALSMNTLRAIRFQRSEVNRAVQKVTLVDARLNDALNFMHTLYLALDPVLSAEIANAVDDASRRKISPANAKNAVSLALLLIRPQWPGTESEGKKLQDLIQTHVQMEILPDIFQASGPQTAQTTRYEHAEDYLRLVFSPSARLRHIITDPHIKIYQRVHRLLLALQSALKASTHVLRTCLRRDKGSRSVLPSINSLCLLRYKVQRMLQGLLTFLTDGLRSSVRKLAVVLQDTNHPHHPCDVPGYRGLHSTFMEGLQRFTLQSPFHRPLLKRVRDLIRIALELPSLLLQDVPSVSAIRSMNGQVAAAKQFLVDTLLNMITAPETSSAPINQRYPDVAQWPTTLNWTRQLLTRIDPDARDGIAAKMNLLCS